MLDTTNSYSPSHVTPLYPNGHVHSYLDPFSIQTAPFLHGLGLHWFTPRNAVGRERVKHKIVVFLKISDYNPQKGTIIDPVTCNNFQQSGVH